MIAVDSDANAKTNESTTITGPSGSGLSASTSEPELTSQTVIKLFHDGKAGLEGLDSDRINRIINNTTRGSRFYMHKLNKQRQVEQQVNSMLNKLHNTTESESARASHYIRGMRNQVLVASCDLTHVIVHIDMDMFFAAVEMRDNPELKELPMAVGGDSMLSTSNYNARKFGVRAAMPGFVAKKLCPQLRIVRPRMNAYREESNKIADVIRQYDANFVPHSLDESSIDLSAHLMARCEQSSGDWVYCARRTSNYEWILDAEVWRQAEEAVNEIRRKVFERTGLTCSAGIAPNKLLAKMCSDMNKPNGQFVFAAQSARELANFVADVDVKKIPGIGPVQQQTLQGLGITTCGELNNQLEKLAVLFTETSMEFYVRVSIGVGSWRCGEVEAQKSESRETTFAATDSRDTFLKLLHELCDELSVSLKKSNTKGRTVTLKLKNDNFKVNVRSRTLDKYTNDAEIMFDTCRSLLDNELQGDKTVRLRLLGARMSGFEDMDKESSKSKKDDSKQQKIDYFLSKIPSEAVKFTLEQEQMQMDDVRPLNFKTDLTEQSNNVSTEPNNLKTSSSELSKQKSPQQSMCTNSLTHFDESHSIKAITTTSVLICPVCGTRRCSDLSQLNQHIDYCLSRDAILSSVAETNDGLHTSPPVASTSHVQKRKNNSPIKQSSPFKMKKLTDYFK